MTTTHLHSDAGQHPTSPPGPTDGVTGPIGVYVRPMAEVINDHPTDRCISGGGCDVGPARWPEPFLGHDLGGAS